MQIKKELKCILINKPSKIKKKQYNQDNKDKLNEKRRERYNLNKDKILEKMREYYKEKRREYYKSYYQNNKLKKEADKVKLENTESDSN